MRKKVQCALPLVTHPNAFVLLIRGLALTTSWPAWVVLLLGRFLSFFSPQKCLFGSVPTDKKFGNLAHTLAWRKKFMPYSQQHQRRTLKICTHVEHEKTKSGGAFLSDGQGKSYGDVCKNVQK